MIMKTITILIFSACFALIISSHRIVAQGISIGAKAGLAVTSFSNIDKDREGKQVPHLGFVGGLVVDFGFTKNFSIQTELLYEQQGMRLKNESVTTPMSAESNLTMHAIHLPVLFKVTFPAGKVRFHLNTGICPSVALGGKQKIIVKGEDGIELTMNDKVKFGKDNWQQFDVSIPVGGGFGVKLGRGQLYLDLRYNIGLIDVINVRDKPEDYKAHYNRSGEITVGYLIPIG
jgi:hypothetical protein